MPGWPAAASPLVLLQLHLLLLTAPWQPAAAAPQDVPAGGMVQRIGGACSSQSDCSRVERGFCNLSGTLGTCQCPESHPINNVINCLTAASVNEPCSISAQCRPDISYAECVHNMCVCGTRYYMHIFQTGEHSCLLRSEHSGEDTSKPVDPAMIAILASLVLMFIIICVVLRLFSKAQFRQNRTILNSANPRLMNASFLKGPLIRSPVDELTRRASRTASITSLRREEARSEPEPETVPAPSYADAAAAAHDGGRGTPTVNSAADVSHVQVEVTPHTR